MNLDKCIRGRRSVRSYLDKPVPKDVINEILEAGVQAPSGMNSQPWRFIVVEDRDTINRISAKTKETLLKAPWPDTLKERFKSEKDTIFYGAPLLILVCTEKKTQYRDVNLLDCGLAAQNMFLKAHERGLGSCFIGFACFLNQDPKSLAEAGVPEGYELVAPLIFGYPAEKPAPKPHEAKVLKWIK